MVDFAECMLVHVCWASVMWVLRDFKGLFRSLKVHPHSSDQAALLNGFFLNGRTVVIAFLFFFFNILYFNPQDNAGAIFIVAWCSKSN